jgi:hypothetical protein
MTTLTVHTPIPESILHLNMPTQHKSKGLGLFLAAASAVVMPSVAGWASTAIGASGTIQRLIQTGIGALGGAGVQYLGGGSPVFGALTSGLAGLASQGGSPFQTQGITSSSSAPPTPWSPYTGGPSPTTVGLAPTPVTTVGTGGGFGGTGGGHITGGTSLATPVLSAGSPGFVPGQSFGNGVQYGGNVFTNATTPAYTPTSMPVVSMRPPLSTTAAAAAPAAAAAGLSVPGILQDLGQSPFLHSLAANLGAQQLAEPVPGTADLENARAALDAARIDEQGIYDTQLTQAKAFIRAADYANPQKAAERARKESLVGAAKAAYQTRPAGGFTTAAQRAAEARRLALGTTKTAATQAQNARLQALRTQQQAIGAGLGALPKTSASASYADRLRLLAEGAGKLGVQQTEQDKKLAQTLSGGLGELSAQIFGLPLENEET